MNNFKAYLFTQNYDLFTKHLLPLTPSTLKVKSILNLKKKLNVYLTEF